MLEHWDTICPFIKDLEKDNTRKPKIINFKRAAALLATGERNVTRVMLEFLRSTVPEFQTVLQASGQPVHVVCNAMRLTLLKLMKRFVQADQLKDVHGSALGCFENVSLQPSPSRFFQENCYQNSTQSAALLDEWKFYQNDGDTLDVGTDQRVDHYWNAVFLLTSVESNMAVINYFPSSQVMPCFGPGKCRL